MKKGSGAKAGLSVANKAGSAQEPTPTSGSFGGSVPPSVPSAAKSLDGLPSSNEGSELFTTNPDLAEQVKAGVVSALRAADLATPETFEVG